MLNLAGISERRGCLIIMSVPGSVGKLARWVRLKKSKKVSSFED